MIICFGSLNADLIYRVATAPRSGQTIHARDFTLEAGGKGANQAIAAARDGARILMAGAVGQDALAPVALSNFTALGADLSHVVRVTTPTGNAAVVVDEAGRNQITVAFGANALAAQADLSDAELKAASLVLVQLETPVAEVEKLLLRCRALGVRTILNLAPAKEIALEALKSTGLLVVNEDEAESLAAQLGCGAEAAALAAHLGIEVIRTLGSAGSEAATAKGGFTVAAQPVQAVDTTAAGDCFIGVLAASLDQGAELRVAMQRASQAAAICCSRPGSQSSLPSAAEIDAACRAALAPVTP